MARKHMHLALRPAQFADTGISLFGRREIPCRCGQRCSDERVRCGNGLAQAAEYVVERQQRTAAKLDDDRFLDLGQHGAFRLARSHRLIGGGGSLAPLRHRLGIQAVAGSQAVRRQHQ